MTYFVFAVRGTRASDLEILAAAAKRREINVEVLASPEEWWSSQLYSLSERSEQVRGVQDPRSLSYGVMSRYGHSGLHRFDGQSSSRYTSCCRYLERYNQNKRWAMAL